MVMDTISFKEERKIDLENERLRLADIEDPLQRIPLLNSIALACSRTEVSYAIGLLREALSLAKETDVLIYLAQTSLNLARWLGNGAIFDEALEHLDVAKKLFKKTDDRDALWDVELVQALILFEKGEFEEAFTIANSVYDHRKAILTAFSPDELVLVSADRLGDQKISKERSQRNNELKLAIATRILALVEAFRMDYTKALYYLDSNFKLWQNLGESQELASALTNAGMVYARIPDYKSAIEFYQRALGIYLSAGATINSITLLTRLSEIKRKTGDLPSAFKDLSDAWEKIQQSDHPQSEIGTCIQFSKYYIAIGDLKNAYNWAMQAFETVIARNIESSKSLIFSLLGKILTLQKKNNEAIKMLKQGLILATETKQLDAEVRCLKYLYLSYKDLGKIDEAFSYLERFQLAESRLLQFRMTSNEKAIQLRFKSRFAQTSDAVYRIENQELLSDIQHLTQELSVLMRQVRKKDEVLGKLKKDSSVLINYSRETQEILKPIFKEISEKLRQSDSEQIVAEKLEGLQTHFMKVLRQQHPSLSKTEVRICALLRLEMSSSEIASILNISIRTVESHRFHIRQKLRMDENESLQEVLKKI